MKNIKFYLFVFCTYMLTGAANAHIYSYSFDWQFETQPKQFDFNLAVPAERYFFGGVAAPQDVPVLALNGNREPTETRLLLKVTGMHSHEYMNGFETVLNGAGEISRFGLLLPEGMIFEKGPSTSNLFQFQGSDSNVIDQLTSGGCNYTGSSRPFFQVMFANIKDVTNVSPAKREAQRGMVEIVMQNPIVSGCLDKIFTSAASTFLNGPFVRYAYGPRVNHYTTTKENLLNVSMLKQIYDGNRHLQAFSAGASSVSENVHSYALRTPVGSFLLANRVAPQALMVPAGKAHVGFKLISPFVRSVEFELPDKSDINPFDPTGSLGLGGIKEKPALGGKKFK